MKTTFRFIIALLCSVLILFVLSACTAQTNTPADSEASPEDSPEENNKAIVLRYFQEILDGEQYNRMPEVLTGTVVMHRPEGTLTNIDMIAPIFDQALSPHTIETTIHEMVASGDYVSVRLSHKMTYSTTEAFMRSRLGLFDVRGKTVEWEAMAMFRFENGKIAEEWVSADELGQLMQIGTLELSVKGQ
jgi:predicted SnoaL-like aldol condensation-catalyzing enzyme